MHPSLLSKLLLSTTLTTALLAGCTSNSPATTDGGAGADGAAACAPAGQYTFGTPVGDPTNPAACPVASASPVAIGADGLPAGLCAAQSCGTCDEQAVTASSCLASLHMSMCGGSHTAYSNYDFVYAGTQVTLTIEGTISTGEVCRYSVVGTR